MLVTAVNQPLLEIVPKRTTTISAINAVVNPVIQNLKNREDWGFK
jgi:predicted transglutaminase-like cysteine proteinase